MDLRSPLNLRSLWKWQKTTLVTIITLVAWNVLAWILFERLYISEVNNVTLKETRLAEERAADLADSIQRNLSYLHGIPDLFSELLRVRWAVTRFGTGTNPSPLSIPERIKKWSNDAALRNLSQYLQYAAKSLNADQIFVVNAAGDAIAASNWDAPITTLGLRLADRQYFLQAKAGSRGFQYAVGKATRIPGLFFSTPIIIDGKFYGAAVAKADVPGLSFLTQQLNAFVVDDNGVVILARNKELEMKALPDSPVATMTDDQKNAIYLMSAFPTLEIEQWSDKTFTSLVRFHGEAVPHILASKKLPAFHLTVYADSAVPVVVDLRREIFWYYLLSAILGSVLILAASGSVVYFRTMRQSREQLWKQAHTDTLTGLPNRDMMRDRLMREIARANRSGLPMAVLLVDLDQFKEVNDTLGHDMGDLLLNEVARRIGGCVRNSDTVARLGGDEFIILLPDLHDVAHAGDIATKIIDSLAEPFTLRSEALNISASIGITTYPADARTIDDLLKNADQAMYVAKRNGRNRFSYFTLSLQEDAQRRVQMKKDLRAAVTNSQFRVHFQPIVQLSDGAVHKAEALLRWEHPVNGMVAPADFIDLAEETRLIIDIGAWVRVESAFWCKRWKDLYHEQFQISVNKSPVEFMDDTQTSRVSTFLNYLREQGLSGSNFVYEITEGMLLRMSSSVSDQLMELRDAGIQVALDDFGTGYSSLSYLKKLDIDYIKIDRSFVQNLEPGSEDLVLCEAIIGMAHKLGMAVVAEGVETEQQLQLLVHAHCDYAQGYLISRPLAPDAFEAWMNERSGMQQRGGAPVAR